MEKTRTFYKLDREKIKQLLTDKDVPPGAKVIVFNLAYRLGGKDYSHPSQETIGKDIGLGSRQVRNHLQLLKRRGFIFWKRGGINEVTGKRFNSNQYFLTNLLIKKEKSE